MSEMTSYFDLLLSREKMFQKFHIFFSGYLKSLQKKLAFLILLTLILPNLVLSDSNVLLKPQTIVVGGDYCYQPYEFLDKKGNPAGYNVDLTKAIAQIMQVNIDIKLDNWSYIRNQAQTGEIDLLQGMFYSEERAKVFDFSTPHKVVEFTIFIRKGDPSIKSSQGLKGKAIVVQNGDVMHDYVIEKNISDDLIIKESPADVMRALAGGKGQCALVSQDAGFYWIKKLKLTNIVTAGVAIETRNYCYAAPKGNAELIAKVSESLEILRQTGQYQQIYDKWLGILVPSRFSVKTVIEYAGIVLFILLVLLILTFVWSTYLKKKVKASNSQLRLEESERSRAEFALRMSEQCFRTIADYTYFWELWISPNGRILWTNPAVTRVTGYSIEEIMRMPNFPESIVYESDKRKTLNVFKTALKGTTGSGMQFRLHRKDGVVIWTEFSWQPIYDDKGISQGTRSSICDITERKLAEEKIKHLNAVLYAIRDINQLVIRQKDAEKLIHGICNSLVTAREYQSVWIVLTNEDQQFVIAAEAGIGELFNKFVDNLKKGNKPICFALALNQSDVLYIDDVASKCGDCVFLEFYEESKVLSVRLEHADRIFGVITISMAKNHTGDEEELELFKSFADDIAFALHMIELKNAEQKSKLALEESEARFRDIALNTSDLVWEIDKHCRYVYCSERAFNSLGYKPQELLGKSPFDLMEPQEVEKVKEVFGNCVRNHQPLVDIENWNITKDGRSVCLLTNGVPVFSSQGEYLGYRGVDKDITDWKLAIHKIRESEERLRKYFELGLIGMAITSPQKGWIEVNQKLCDMLGYSKGELLKKTWIEITHPEDIEPDLKQFARILNCEIDGYTLEKRFIRKDGKIIDTILSLKSISKPDGTVDYLVVLLDDITQQKQFAIERERLNNALELKNKELESIIYVASHDLKSPLLNIQGFCNEMSINCESLKELLVEKNITPDIIKKAGELVETKMPASMNYITKSAAKIDMVLSGLLRLSRLGRASLEFKLIDMDKMISEILDTMEFQIKKAAVNFEITHLPTCIGDECQLNQVFSNLIGNAIKYLDKTTSAEIKISGCKDGRQVLYSIMDNGIGIDKRHQDIIFEIFHRLDPDSTDGEGLGLTIVKRILDRHNAKIWVESDLGKGSIFYVSMPEN